MINLNIQITTHVKTPNSSKFKEHLQENLTNSKKVKVMKKLHSSQNNRPILNEPQTDYDHKPPTPKHTAISSHDTTQTSIIQHSPTPGKS